MPIRVFHRRKNGDGRYDDGKYAKIKKKKLLKTAALKKK